MEEKSFNKEKNDIKNKTSEEDTAEKTKKGEDAAEKTKKGEDAAEKTEKSEDTAEETEKKEDTAEETEKKENTAEKTEKGEDTEDAVEETEGTAEKKTGTPPPSSLKSKLITAFLFILILLLAAYLRFSGINWDQEQHLHPDERFLTMVVSALDWPSGFGEYMTEGLSPLNPRNKGYSFFVYGSFPMTLVKGISIILDRTEYDRVHLVGRGASAFFDLGSIIFLFLIALKLYRDKRIALLAAFFMATTVLSIQQSHFFIVDNFAVFFVMASLYWLVRAQLNGKYINFIITGLFFGLAMACKVSIFTLAGLITIVGIYRIVTDKDCPLPFRIWKTSVMLVIAALTCIFIFRIAMPDAFQSSNILNLRPAERWLANIREVRHMMNGDVDFPPGKQWTNRTPFIFPWKNMVLWGMGIPLGLISWAGWLTAGWLLLFRKKSVHLIPFCWVGILFLHQGGQWVKSMRYIMPLYPMIILLGAWLLIAILDYSKEKEIKIKNIPLWNKVMSLALIIFIAAGTLIWSIAFTSIYRRDHSRVEASKWIFENISPGSVLFNEAWDDALPLRIDGKNPFGGIYKGLDLNWYDEDTHQKLTQAIEKLNETDYIIITSNRAYDSIPRLPMRYPMTIKYYNELFRGNLGFEKVAEFTSYPSIFGIEIPDQSAEEVFTVYDHPRVQIFKKTEDYSGEKVFNILGSINWDEIVRLNPRDATKAPTALKLSDSDWKIYSSSGTWRELFNKNSIVNKIPVLFWIIILDLLGLIAAPYLFIACKNLCDRGYSVSKLFGLLMTAWLVWFMASLKITAFSRAAIILAILITGGGAIFIYRKNSNDIKKFFIENLKLLLAAECVFWGFFFLFLIIRWANPDLWHPVLGGEKPMDFAYFNSIIKSVYFPPYDPWFAKGYINYYYFGFVMAATITKLLGIIPSVAYNLAIPTLFAMTATGAFGTVLTINGNKDKVLELKDFMLALLGSFFVAVIGNLAEIKLVFDSVANLGSSNFTPKIFCYLVRIWEGITGGLLKGHLLPVRNEWWYWNATRVISHPPGEAGPINEMPWFTYLYGDLHAHGMALPITLAILLIMVAIIRSERIHIMAPLFMALGIGALWATNTWDLPAYSSLFMAALIFFHWKRKESKWQIIKKSALIWIGVIILSYILYFPYHDAFVSGYTSFQIWNGSKTPLEDYLIIHGFFLFIIISAMMSDFICGENHNNFVKFQKLFLNNTHRIKRFLKLFKLIGKPAPLFWIIITLNILLWITGLIFLRFNPIVGIYILVINCSLFLLFRTSPSPAPQALHVFTIIGLSLTVLVEYLVLKGDISRMNTVFKFYLQVWVLFGIASALGVKIVFESLTECKSRFLTLIWPMCFFILFFCTALYPVLSTRAKILDRFDRTVGATLDGSLYMEKAVYHVEGKALELKWDKYAMDWICENIDGSPIIAEANTFPILYGWGNRFSCYTGLPSVIGWDWHQRQQRGITSELVKKRIDNINLIYSSISSEETYKMLKNYDVEYIITGGLERAFYSHEGIEKFSVMDGILWDLVYENEETQIYRVKKDVVNFPDITLPTPVPEPYLCLPPVNPFNPSGDEIAPGNLVQPRDLAIDEENNIYVADFRNHRIQKFDLSGNFIFARGKRGDDFNEFEDPSGLCVDTKNGNIFIADTWNHRIQKFSTEGQYLETIKDGFYGPRDVAVDEKGNIYVCDTGNKTIKKMSPEGKLISTMGTTGESPLVNPWNIEVGKDGYIYVADSGDYKIKVYTSKGEFLKELDLHKLCKNKPEGFYMFLLEEDIIVSDSVNNFIIKISKEGELKNKLEVTCPAGVVMTPAGEIIFADHCGNRLVKTSF